MPFQDPEDGFVFEPVRYDGTLRSAQHPFTKEKIKLPRNGTLNATEAKAVKALLASVASKQASNMLTLADGFSASVYNERDLSSQLIVDGRGNMSEAFAHFLHRLLVAGNWCIRGETAFVVASKQSIVGLPPVVPELPEDVPQFPREVIVCATPGELAKLLGV